MLLRKTQNTIGNNTKRLLKARWTSRLNNLRSLRLFCPTINAPGFTAFFSNRMGLAPNTNFWNFAKKKRAQESECISLNSAKLAPIWSAWRAELLTPTNHWAQIKSNANFFYRPVSAGLYAKIRRFFLFSEMSERLAQYSAVYRVFYVMLLMWLCCILAAGILAVLQCVRGYEVFGGAFWSYFGISDVPALRVISFFFELTRWWVGYFDLEHWNGAALFGGPPPLLHAHISRLTLSFFFQDYEKVISYAEFMGLIWSYVESIPVHYSLSACIVILALCCTCAFFLIKFFFLYRGDAWQLFIKMTYFSSLTSRIQHLDSLNQIVHGRLLLFYNSEALLSTADCGLRSSSGTAVQLRRQSDYLRYYFSQTVGGVTGFVDLFPNNAAYYNKIASIRIKIKTSVFFRKIRGIIWKKTKFTGKPDGAKFFGSMSHEMLKRNAISPTQLSGISQIFSPKTYLDVGINVIFRVIDGLWNVSKVGDSGVFKLRQHFFNLAVISRDPWDDYDTDDVRYSNKRARFAIMPSKTNWYGRELNTVVASQTLNRVFGGNSLSRFLFKPHNSLNDYSFWVPELNYAGQDTYSSMWDTFDVENAFDISLLRAQKFEPFERSEANEDDEFHPEYVEEDLEIFFEDGLLHKDFELIFFDHEFDDLLARGQLDEWFVEFVEEKEEIPKLEEIFTNESLIYGAGQERDHSIKTNSTSYSGLYGQEYGTAAHYRDRVTESVYSDLADFFAVNSDSLIPHTFGIPAYRALFYWGAVRAFDGVAIRERAKLGRFMYFYWRIAQELIGLSYYVSWRSIFFSFGGSWITWVLLVFVLVVLGLSEFLPNFFWFPELYTLIIMVMILGLLLFGCLGVTAGGVRFSVIIRDLILSLQVAYCFFVYVFGYIWLKFSKNFSNQHITRLSQINKKLAAHKDGPYLMNFYTNSYQEFAKLNLLGVDENAIITKLACGSAGTNYIKFLFLRYYVINRIGVKFARAPEFTCFNPQNNWSVASVTFLSRSWINTVTPNVQTLTSSVLCFDLLADYSVWNNSSSGARTLIFDLLLQDNKRFLLKMHALGNLTRRLSINHSGSDWFIADCIQNSLLISTAKPSARSILFSDLVFSAVERPLLQNFEKYDSVSSQKSYSPASSLSLASPSNHLAVGSRARTRALSFFETRSAQFSGSVSLSVYENFLRLFFSNEILRSFYAARTARYADLDRWSYYNKIQFTSYATPLHDKYPFST